MSVRQLRVQVLDELATVRLEMGLDPSTSELLELQLGRSLENIDSEAFVGRFQAAIAEALVNAVQYELKPPSRAQIQYAIVIATALAVPLAPEVLRYRGQMHTFLDAHMAAYSAHKAARRAQPKGPRPSHRKGEDDPF